MERVVEHEVKIKNLEGWQKQQNGHLKDLRDNHYKLLWFMLSTLMGVVVSIALQIISLILKGG